MKRCGLGCGVVVLWITWEVSLVSCGFAFVVGSVGWLFSCSTHMSHALPPYVVDGPTRDLPVCICPPPPLWFCCACECVCVCVFVGIVREKLDVFGGVFGVLCFCFWDWFGGMAV